MGVTKLKGKYQSMGRVIIHKARLPDSKFADYLGTSDMRPNRAVRLTWMRRRREQRDALVPYLFRKYPENHAILAIAERIASCRLGRPCGSCACPACYEAMANRLTDSAMTFLSAQLATGGIACAITVIPEFGASVQNLREIDFINFKRSLNRRLDQAGVGLTIGVLEYSRSELQTGQYPGSWVLHFHGVTITNNLSKLRAGLKKAFPRTSAVRRPTRVQEWDGCEDWIRYWCKAGTIRHIQKSQTRYSETARLKQFGKSRKKDRLQSHHRLELLTHRHNTGFDPFIFNRKCQLRLSPQGPILVTQMRHNIPDGNPEKARISEDSAKPLGYHQSWGG